MLTVSTSALLVVEADGKQVFHKQFRCGPGKGEWKKAEFKPQWQVYQNLFDRDYTATIPAGTRQVRVRVADGDWLEIGQLGLKPASAGARRPRSPSSRSGARSRQPSATRPDVPGGPFLGLPMQDRAWLWKTCIEPWKEAEAQGIGVMVGEWGAFNKTPHDVVLRWAEDCLTQLAEGRLGLGDVELPRPVRRLGQRPRRCPLRRVRGPQAGPQAAGCFAALLERAGDGPFRRTGL